MSFERSNEADRFEPVRVFIDSLARSGLTEACVCPGSRSTPLALLLRDHPRFRTWMHVDERSAAFFAVGIAKASGKPAVLVSTSGTAAVNFAPAVVEASHAHVPLIVLTADRPPELHHVGASQTIDQTRLFGAFVRWFVDLPLPETAPDATRFAGRVAVRAVAVATAPGGAGPVHVNFPLREPLVPARRPWPAQETGRASVGPLQSGKRALDEGDVELAARALERAKAGLIVCGPQLESEDARFPRSVARLARLLRFPLIADPLSQVRAGPGYDQAPEVLVDAYDLLLRDAGVSGALHPDLIVRFGGTPVSKALTEYLGRHVDCDHWIVGSQPAHDAELSDPASTATALIQTDPALWCDAIGHRMGSGQVSDSTGAEIQSWLRRWVHANERVREATRAELERATGEELSEPGVFEELAAALPQGCTLFAGNSMPIRDLDAFFPARPASIRFLANRGVSGIDGVVSTALGASAVTEGPLVLVLGDLSFYHDLNGLLAAKRHGLRATIVLVNNDGGGIFSLLPQAGESAPYAEHFEEVFGTPHDLDFRPAAELYGLSYRRPRTRAAFRAALEESLLCPNVTLVEVRTTRARNAELHTRLSEAAAHAARAAVVGDEGHDR